MVSSAYGPPTPYHKIKLGCAAEDSLRSKNYFVFIFLNQSVAESIDTLVHELAHITTFGHDHDKVFLREYQKLSAHVARYLNAHKEELRRLDIPSDKTHILKCFRKVTRCWMA